MEKEFNPDINNGNSIFGLSCNEENALLQIIPVPWDLTASYGKGSSKGPEAVFNASFQLDLYKEFYPDYWKSGLFLRDIPSELEQLNQFFNHDVVEIFKAFNEERMGEDKIIDLLSEINDACHKMNQFVYDEALQIINKKKLPVVLGGDHSSPLGLITALSETNESFGILHIDAHADLRKSYQGLVFSHASIMFNALRLQAVTKLVQVGIRDYCSEEDRRIRNSQGRILSFTDRYINHSMYEGTSWQELTAEIINSLPAKVYVSFDIDGLEPWHCPNTGTPVPGGLNPGQINYLLEGVCESGRKIIGADLCEVAPDPDGKDEWDANVGARALLDLCMYCIHSNNK